MMTPVTSRTVSASQGWIWLKEGFELFRKNPLMLIILLVIVFVINLILGRVPFIGALLTYLLAPIFAAGLALGCRDLDKGQDLEINHLFAGFKQQTKPLFMLGLIYFAAILVVVVIISGLTDLQSINTILAGEQLPEGQKIDTSALRVLLGLALIVPILAAYTFAPILVMLNQQTPQAALQASLIATIRNMLPFFVYGVVIMALAVPVALLGGITVAMTRSEYGMYALMAILLLVLMPVVICSFYTSYRDIFNKNIG